MLQPVVRRTWAPQACTPVHYSWDRHDRVSVISAITVSPQRRRLGLYFDSYEHNITAEDFEQFVDAILAQLGRGIILVMDRWPVHRSGARRLVRRFARRLDLEWLPPYAPELNPTEQVWTRTKYGHLANYIPDNVRELSRAVRRSLRSSRGQQNLLRSFFNHAQLSL
jgi:transposase